MKKVIYLGLVLILTISFKSYASEGESGYFGGISEGVMLPKTISSQVNTKPSSTLKLYYKEIIFITGEPTEVTGNLVLTRDEKDLEKDETGTYKQRYVINAQSKDGQVKLNRTVEFETLFSKYDCINSKQIKKDLTVTRWDETISHEGVDYKVDYEMSDFGRGKNVASFIIDETPGITFYNGDISYRVIYTFDEDNTVEVNVEGNSYGFVEPWAKAEKQNLIYNIDKSGEEPWQMSVRVNPFLNAKKTLIYEKADPFIISFPGTYTQKFETFGGLTYEVLTSHKDLPNSLKKGSFYLTTPNDFEKLKIPGKLPNVPEGHFTRSDITKLMSMEIIDESSINFQPFEAITRSDYIKQLCKALNIIPKEEKKSRFSRKTEEEQIFEDVSKEHPNEKWIKAAYDAKLIMGNGDNKFYPDKPISRQDAFVLLMRSIGLERLGINNIIQTDYKDDYLISSYARKAINGGTTIGLFKGDENGYIYPQKLISKGDAAVIINRIIDFLREDIATYYAH